MLVSRSENRKIPATPQRTFARGYPAELRSIHFAEIHQEGGMSAGQKQKDSRRLISTTVRFSEDDLRYLQRLEQKLGIGRIHVLRFAIRRLAELEGLLEPPVEVRENTVASPDPYRRVLSQPGAKFLRNCEYT